MSARILHVVSLLLSEYYRLYPYVCAHETRCIRICVRILQVVSVFMSAYYTLFPYFSPHLHDVSACLSENYRLYLYVCLSAYCRLYPYLSAYYSCIRMYVRMIHVVTVFLSAYYRFLLHFCSHWHVVSVCLSEYYRLYPYACLSAYYRLYAYVRVLLAFFFLHAENCFHLYACPQITGTALCMLQALSMSLRTLQFLSRVSAYFRLHRLVKAQIAAVTVTSVIHTDRQLIPVLYTTVCHFVYQFLKLPGVKCSSNENCALQERMNKQINQSPY